MDYKRIIAVLLIFFPFVSSFASQTRYVIDGVPHIKQGDYLCVAASCAMVLNYHKYDFSQIEIAECDIRNIEKEGRMSFDMDLHRIVMYLKEQGIRVDLRFSNIDRIKEYIERNMPVIVPMWSDLDRKTKHARVAIGFDDKKKTVIVIDPADGKEHEIAYKSFVELWNTGKTLMLLIYPN